MTGVEAVDDVTVCRPVLATVQLSLLCLLRNISANAGTCVAGCLRPLRCASQLTVCAVSTQV